ncbi:MAG: hypothetical protein PHW04_11570 [Candidatus Wallbacteria bacterium]|nr:hypothetical protein [Candidatus Wallbacteria bacterium]
MNVLLVEPDYVNKFPPLGLMKLATYHKNRGDKVEFYKGKAPYTLISRTDRVYITTLFTFYYEITIETIKHYLNYLHKDSVYIGGIASTILYRKFKKELCTDNVIRGQLTNSSMIGFSDNVNIDELSLDYDILDDIIYQYPVKDNFFIHTTRGCPRRCEFCAVPVLESEFKDTNNVIKQITSIREKYGDMRNVMIMDNNILYSRKLSQIVKDLNRLGFINQRPNFVYPHPLELLVNKVLRRKNDGDPFAKQIDDIIDFLIRFSTKIQGRDNQVIYKNILLKIQSGDNKLEIMLESQEILNKIIDIYRYKQPLQRYIDFNQGIDARLINEKKMKTLSKLPIKPFRLAYDNIESTENYQNAFNTAYKHGVKYFSNYILYNYKDKPEDLWNRLHNNTDLYKEKDDIQAFSFPMKYAPIGRIDRDFIGINWNKKYLSAINLILNVTKGVVAKEKDFFYKAYGENIEEYLMILTMPADFIKHRFLFEKKGFIAAWKQDYLKLDPSERKTLLEALCGKGKEKASKNVKIKNVLGYYTITKENYKNKPLIINQSDEVSCRNRSVVRKRMTSSGEIEEE